MSTFDIRFIDDEIPPAEIGGIFGRIAIGDFNERFLTDTSFWVRSQYEAQWRDAASQIAAGDDAALVTSISDPASSNIVRWWAMYLQGDLVVFQEQLLFLEELREPFVASLTGRSMRKREEVSDEGHPISEWTVARNAIRAFAAGARARTTLTND